ncbi:MAG: hypothetical protein H6657_24965 [Ardenticatenaceae bacterium]|nr:hypothetical protein [Ardenticatenaceae bacterium]
MVPLNNLSLPQLKSDVHAALKHWHSVDDKSKHLLSNLLLVQNKRRSLGPPTPSALRLATNKVLLEGLEQLENQHPQAAAILQKRFLDQKNILKVSQQLHLTVDQVKHHQRDALLQLANILYAQEVKVREVFITSQESQLEARSYTKLFGVDGLSEKLLTLLSAAQSPWVITLSGIGGIGKTSLANHTVRQSIRCLNYEEVIWLKIANQGKKSAPPLARPEHTFHQIINNLSKRLLPALPGDLAWEDRVQQLQQLLKNQSFLIVIDNLELRADTTFLLAELVAMAQPSRFLLTSRIPPADHAGSLTIYLPELSEADSIALIRHYAGEIGFTEAAAANQEELLPIYQLVGGNPFALKQLVNLAKFRPLPGLLASLKKHPLGDGEEIYRHILKETWLTLSDEAKAVLAIMPLAAEGGMDPEQILELSGLPQEHLWPAINELIGRSLLEVKTSNIWDRFYGIHRLTELFIRSLLDDDDI